MNNSNEHISNSDTNYSFNLGLAFYAVADQHASRTALTFPDERKITYQQLNEYSNQVASLRWWLLPWS